MPAATLLFTDGFDSNSEGFFFKGLISRDEGEGVKGVEKGWAAEVEVAAGGSDGKGVDDVVLRKRRDGGP